VPPEPTLAAWGGGVGYVAGVPTHVALLRGINVGSHNQVAMADLRALVADMGHTDVTTYLRSGNVIFTAAAGTAGAASEELAADLERAIAKALDLRLRVVVAGGAEVARVVRDNPYPEEPNPKLLHAVFLSEDPGADLAERVATVQAAVAAKGSRDTARIVGRALYLHTPDGFGRSEIGATLSKIGAKKETGLAGTARNWATVTALHAKFQ
jgi:uncharacterized protein (DUF1697 family)